MKAITIRQPHASLIAAGVKTIDTRPRSTSYRGRLAIHAAAPISSGEPGPADLAVHELPIPGDHVGRRICWCGWDAAECLREGLSTMPRGAVVASAVLTDCVPIVDTTECTPLDWPSARFIAWDADAGVYLVEADDDDGFRGNDLVDIRFGDFTPGRWALLLDDIKPTTERCPWCWGADDGFDTPCLKPDHRYDPDCFSCQYSDCPACGGDGACDPVPARGQQAVPWEWQA